MMAISTRRIDELNPTTIPRRDHAFAGMRIGIANRIRIEQILSLLETEDIPDGAVTLAKLAADARAASNLTFDDTAASLGETNVQGAIDALAAPARVDVASAATTNIGAADSLDIRITGTTTITAFDTVAEGVRRNVLFADALTLTHNATSLILPGGDDITTAAGDVALFRSEGSGNWRMVRYSRADGRPLVGVDGTTTITRTGGTNSTVLVRAIAKAWANLNGTGTIALRDSLNVSSVVDNEIGNYTFNFTNSFDAADYSITVSARSVGSLNYSNIQANIEPTASSASTGHFASTTSNIDPVIVAVDMNGDLA